MGDGNPWSRQKRDKKKLRREMQAYYETEYLLDDEEKKDYGKKNNK
jgi:hypothetical protein